MFNRSQLIMLWVVTILLAGSAVLAGLSMLPRKSSGPSTELRAPLAVDLIEPERMAAAQPVRGMRVEDGGYGTILSAPGRSLDPKTSADPPDDPASTNGPPVAAKVSGFVRLLSRLRPLPPPTGLQTYNLDIPPSLFATVILRNGCLRVAEPGEPHAIVPAGTKLYLDSEGYLTLGVLANGAATNPRLGEPAWWTEGYERQVETSAVERIRALCGPGPVKVIGLAQSVSASQAAADGLAARNIVDMYGLPQETALARVRDCRRRLAQNGGVDPHRMIVNPCGSTPPSPVADPRTCPAGTTLSGGLCRTPAGHIRPIPAI
jgi:hypothetical protein